MRPYSDGCQKKILNDTYMNKQNILISILVIGIVGVLFSGYLSYIELWGNTTLSCPAPGAPNTVFGYPACVYGFLMYSVIVVLALLGVRTKKIDS